MDAPVTPATDRSPTGEHENPLTSLTRGLGNIAARAAQQAKADRNWQPPALTTEHFGKAFYPYAPTRLARLMGSPMRQTGKFARGTNQERIIASGWGDVRYRAHSNDYSRHMGLDYTADFADPNDPIIAVAHGIVRFVGFEHVDHKGRTVASPRQTPDGDIANINGEIVGIGRRNAPQITVGYGGIIVMIEHDGDFANYRSEYMHLASVDPRWKAGEEINEGDVIGYVGGTGGNRGHYTSGYHLHFQVKFAYGKNKAIVRPTSLVPNFWPGHEDSTNTDELTMFSNTPFMRAAGIVARGLGVKTNEVFGVLQAAKRSTDMSNLRGADYARLQAEHAERVARQMSGHQLALYEANAKFSAGGLEVQNAMAFNFSTGVWETTNSVAKTEPVITPSGPEVTPL